MPSSPAPIVPVEHLESPTIVLGLFNHLSDPRDRRGVRHTLPVVLTITLTAMLAGAKSFAALGQWAKTLTQATADRLGIDSRPETSTIRRVLSALDPVQLDALTGAWMWLRCRQVSGRVVVSFDGKTIRGAKNSGNRAPHLVAGLLHGADIVISQTAVDAKTNEIPALRNLLAQMCLATVLVVADALHTQVETARQILTQHGAYLFTIKQNQPTLYDTCRGLPWKHVPGTSTSERHRGHRITRTIKVVAADNWTGFPGAAQIARLTRTRTDKDNNKKTTETVYLICSLPAHHASPKQLLDWVRHHWHIENRIHWVRDVTFGEDQHTAHTGNGPHVMATFRNLTIGLLRSHGHTNITAALRHYAWHPDDLTELILTSTNRTMP